jgi:hypothetical protein
MAKPVLEKSSTAQVWRASPSGHLQHRLRRQHLQNLFEHKSEGLKKLPWQATEEMLGVTCRAWWSNLSEIPTTHDIQTMPG